MVMPHPRISFILATHNRRDVLLNTLERVEECGLHHDAFEIIVVDNASSDGTPAALRERFPNVILMALSRNRGSCAKGLATDSARGDYVVFLDDDSFPHAGSIERMIEHFEDDDQLGAAGFVVHLPDGSRECSAFPNVFIGCGVGLRASALQRVGGLDVDLFMQAEEYDLSFRLVNAGWRVETFDDLHVDHLKTERARISARTTYFDTRNNLLLVDRYLSPPYRGIYRRDWLERYRWLAAANQHGRSFARGLAAATLRGRSNSRRYADNRLNPAAVETLFRLAYVRSRMETLRANGVARIVLADLGKNVYAFYRGATQSGLSVLAIADDRFARPGRKYRSLPVVTVDRIARLDPDALVVGNTSPVHAAATQVRLTETLDIPVHNWFEPASVSFSAAV